MIVAIGYVGIKGVRNTARAHPGVSVLFGHCSATESRSAHSANRSPCVGSRARHTQMLEPAVPASHPICALRGKGGAPVPLSEGSGAQTIHFLEVTPVDAGEVNYSLQKDINLRMNQA